MTSERDGLPMNSTFCRYWSSSLPSIGFILEHRPGRPPQSSSCILLNAHTNARTASLTNWSCFSISNVLVSYFSSPVHRLPVSCMRRKIQRKKSRLKRRWQSIVTFTYTGLYELLFLSHEKRKNQQFLVVREFSKGNSSCKDRVANQEITA